MSKVCKYRYTELITVLVHPECISLEEKPITIPARDIMELDDILSFNCPECNEVHQIYW